VIKSHHFLGAVLFVLLCVAGIQVQAAETADRQYGLADQGSLRLKVPTLWNEQLEQDRDQFLAGIVFTPKSGSPFGVVLTPIWPAQKDAPNPDREALQKLVQRAAEEVKSQTVEKTIEVVEFEGASGIGYYFSVTDRAPNAGQYKYLTQGILPVGPLTVAFTIYTNDGQQGIVTDVLTMLKSATHSKDKAS
jgi:hypothetical protein